MDNRTYIVLSVGKANVTDLASISDKLISDLINLSKTPEYIGVGKTRRESISARFKVLVKVLRQLVCNRLFAEVINHGLEGFVKNEFKLLKLAHSLCRSRSDFEHLLFGLKVFHGREITRIEYSNNVFIRLKKGSIDVTDIGVECSQIIKDLQCLSESKYYSGNKGHSKKSMQARFRVFVRAIRTITISDDHQNISKKGLDAFREHDFKLLKLTYRFLKEKKPEFNELKRGLEEFYDVEIPQHKYIDNLIPIYFSSKKKWRHIDISKLHRLSPKLAEELVQITKDELELIDQKSYDLETLHSRLMKINNYSTEVLVKNFPDVSNKYGFQCLAKDNYRIQKFIFAHAQQQVKEKSISVRTGAAIQGSFRWLMDILDLPYIDCYRVSFSRRLKHERRERLQKTYTDIELKEIIFHLEKALANATSLHQKVSLLFAKIQIKTCWNASPIANIELSDIVEIEVAESKKIQILVQKNRASYRVDTYSLDGQTISSVMHDINQVASLTEQIRMPNDELSSYLFIYSDYGKIKRIDNKNITANISQQLARHGCSVRYDSMKIRKNGSNHIYREVNKKIKEYLDCFNHSYEVFLKNYHQIQESVSLDRLHYAVNVMQKYFTGRKISKKITVLTEPPEKAQTTPCGHCVSSGNDDEAIQYLKEHRSLNKDNSKMESWCADYLACIWCRNFRTVADADHVWQLLSYKEFVLADMRASLIYTEETSKMSEVIQILEERVEIILEEIALLNKSAVADGKYLTESKGLHPYWEFTSCMT